MILVLSLSAMLISAVHSLLHPPHYSSSILCYINDPMGMAALPNGSPSGDRNSVDMAVSANWSSVFHDVHSTEMSTFLIAQYDLIRHYELDPSSPTSMDEAIECLSDNIDVNRTEENGMQITVRDHDRSKAADMANAIYTHLLSMSEARNAEGLSRAIGIYTKTIDGTSDRGRKVINDLLAMANTLHRSHATGSLERSQDPLAPVDIKIQEIANQLSNINEDLIRNARSIELAMAASQTPGSPIIRSVRSAQWDMNTSARATLMTRAAIWGIATYLFLILFLIFWEMQGPEIRSSWTTQLVP